MGHFGRQWEKPAGCCLRIEHSYPVKINEWFTVSIQALDARQPETAHENLLYQQFQILNRARRARTKGLI
jgi:hypothetical protein